MLHVQVFLSGRHASADVALRFIDIQDLPGLRRQVRVDIQKPLCYILMYRTLTDSELLCSLTHSCIVVYDVIGDGHCPLFDIFFQGLSP